MMIMIFLHFLNLYNNDNGHLVDAEAPRSRPRVSCPPPPAAALSPTFETFTFYICHPPLRYLHFTFYVVRPFEESHILHFTLSDSLKDFTFYIVTLAQPVQSNIFYFILQNKFSSRRWKWLFGQFFHLLSNSPSPCLDLTPGKKKHLTVLFHAFYMILSPPAGTKVI